MRVVDVYNVNIYDQHQNVEQVHDTPEDMVLSSILVPLELNELLNCAGFKNLKLLGLIDQTHEIAITINKLNLIVVQVLSDVLSDLGQNVNGVGNLVDFAGVDL